MKIIHFFKKHWAVTVIILIVILGMYIRLLDYRWSYLRNIDSYAFYRTMDMIVENGGALPDHDNLILAPYGHALTFHLMPYQYIGAYSYMFFKIFIPDLQLWEYLVYFPVLLASLMAIPMYFIGKILYDKRAGILAAFFIVFDMAIMTRTLGGDPDSDAFTLLLPLIVVALFLISYKYIDIKKALDRKAIFYSVLTGIALGLWAYSWAGWWYIVWLLTGFIIIRLIINYAMLRNIASWFTHSKSLLEMFIIIFIVYFFMTVPILGINHIQATIQGPFTFSELKTEETQFPNVYVSVAELQESGEFKSIIQRTSAINLINQQTGEIDPILFFILPHPFILLIYSIIYLFYSSSKNKYNLDKFVLLIIWLFIPIILVWLSTKIFISIAAFFIYLFALILLFGIKEKNHIDTLLLLGIWFIGPLMATLGAVRFSILFSAPMAIGAGILLSKLLRLVTKEDKKIEE